jgi:hypothetical protein
MEREYVGYIILKYSSFKSWIDKFRKDKNDEDSWGYVVAIFLIITILIIINKNK